MNFFDDPFGLGTENSLGYGQVASRAVVVFLGSIVLVRLAQKRFFAKKNAFDVVMALVLASMLARAINGREPLFQTLFAGLLLVLLHRLLSALAFKFSRLDDMLKGHRNVIIEDGAVCEDVLEQHRVSRKDMEEQLRLEGVEDPSAIKKAYLERSGEISVIKKSP